MLLKIVSFNIRYCDDDNGNTIVERAPRLASIIKQYEPDIIGLQEYRPKWEREIEHYFGDEYEIFNKYRNETIDVESSPILWRKDKFECIKKGYFWLSETPEVESRGWDEKCNCFRICEYAIIEEKHTQEQVVIMNTHLGFGDSGQVASAKLIYEYCRKISDSPTIVIGDFNMTPNSKGYKEMSNLFTDVNVLTANDFSSTYHGYKPEENKDQHIDYCFINEKVIPINQEIIKTLVDGKYPSDHYGLYVICQVSEENATNKM